MRTCRCCGRELPDEQLNEFSTKIKRLKRFLRHAAHLLNLFNLC